MADKGFIEPDLDFIREIGADSPEMQNCYQCSTCSVVCPISPDVNPFPRKEMIWAQWGLKDRLMADPDIWLCHNCNDCSLHCPRGARPGDLIASIRNYFYRVNSVPAFLGEWMSSPKYLPMLIAVPVFLILVFMGLNGTLGGIPEGEIIYKKMMPALTLIDPIFLGATLFVVLSLGISISKFWKMMNESAPPPVAGKGMPVAQAIIATIQEILTHSRFDECGQAKQRTTSHKYLIYSFIALAVVTGIIAFGEWTEILHERVGIHSIPILHFIITPLALYNPVKIVANIGAIVLLVGIWTAIQNRKSDAEGDKYGNVTYQDWFLLYDIFAIVITGIGAEIFRLAGVAVVAYPIYFCHLIAVFMLIAYLPFGKFAHIVYRTTAIIHSKYTGRYEMTAKDVKSAASA